MSVRSACWALTLCACGGSSLGGEFSGDRDGTTYTEEFVDARVGLVGRRRADTQVIDFVTVVRASTGPLTCDDVWFDSWVQGEDPRGGVVTDPLLLPDTRQIRALLGWNSGQRWDGSQGTSRLVRPGPYEPDEGAVPNVTPPLQPVDLGITASVAMAWMQPDCTGDVRPATTGFIEHGPVFAFPDAHTPAVDAILEWSDLARPPDEGERVAFSLRVEGAGFTAAGGFWAESCGAIFVEDVTPPTEGC